MHVAWAQTITTGETVMSTLCVHIRRVGYGDITSASIEEIWVTILIMVCGLALFASILTSLVDIVQQSSKKARKTTAMQSKLTDVQHWMQQQHLGWRSKSKILRFYAEDWGQLQEEDMGILGVPLPAYLQLAIAVHVDCPFAFMGRA
jgi:predicted PurR-regulated permease PerM